MYQAIITRYIGPTNVRGARIKASADAGSVTLSWDHSVGVEENHCRAARVFAVKFKWSGDWVGGYLSGQGYVFVSSRGMRLFEDGRDGFTVAREVEFA